MPLPSLNFPFLYHLPSIYGCKGTILAFNGRVCTWRVRTYIYIYTFISTFSSSLNYNNVICFYLTLVYLQQYLIVFRCFIQLMHKKLAKNQLSVCDDTCNPYIQNSQTWSDHESTSKYH